MHKLDLVVLGAFVAFDDLRNGVLAFLASQDPFSLIALMAVVWFASKSKGLRGLDRGKTALFGLLGRKDGAVKEGH